MPGRSLRNRERKAAVIFVLSIVAQVVFYVCGAALLVVGALAAVRRLPGNRWIGVRTPETLQVEEAWVLANRTAGPGFLAAGVGLVAGGLSLLTFSGWIAVVFATCAAVFAVVMMSYAGLMGAKSAAIWRENATHDGTLPEVLKPFGAAAGESCCGSADTPEPMAAVATPDDAGTACGVSGGCGACGLAGLCTSEHATAARSTETTQ